MKGNAPELLFDPTQGHGFYDETSREAMYVRLIDFLQRHTKGTPPAAADGGSQPPVP